VVPNVEQQLNAIRRTIEKTIQPALPAEEGFAQEQAGLVLASLDWVMDVVAHEQRYEQVEHADTRELLQELLGLPGAAPDDDAHGLVQASAEPPADLPALRAQTGELKAAAERLFDALAAEPSTRPDARRLLAAATRRQMERERSWTRMTGFSGDVPNVGEVLAAQAAG
jgi:hypothetical protein